jgi:hypothetical protein
VGGDGKALAVGHGSGLKIGAGAGFHKRTFGVAVVVDPSESTDPTRLVFFALAARLNGQRKGPKGSPLF